MINELNFVLHGMIVSAGSLFFARFGKDALINYIALLFLMANIFVIKQINLFGYCVTSADAFIVGISMSCNLLQEFWGKEYARRSIWISFATCLIYLIIAKIIVGYIPAGCDTTQHHFATILQHSTRITFASFIAYLITQFIDIQLYAWIKKISHNRFFVARNYLAITISQFTDTILFSFLGLYGIVDNLWDVMMLSFLVKILALICSTPVLLLAKKIIKK